MLDLGFIHALKQIVRMLPGEAPDPVLLGDHAEDDQGAGRPVPRPIRPRSRSRPPATTVERVDQYVTFVQQAEKQALLTMMLRHGFSERGNMDRVLIFTRTKHGADRVVKLLAGNGIAANAIHGNKSQPQRERALAEFKAGQVKILIATDIAARGIDVSGVSHVINFELPNVAEQYVHRIGRTARAGAAGVAIAFCADDEKAYLRDIEKLTRQRIAVEPLPANFVAEAHRIKTTRTAPPPPSREERREEEQGRRRFPPAARAARPGPLCRPGQADGRSGGRRRASARRRVRRLLALRRERVLLGARPCAAGPGSRRSDFHAIRVIQERVTSFYANHRSR